MKVVIAGGRDYVPDPCDKHYIVQMIKLHNIDEIVSGHTQGADTFGEAIAAELGLKCKLFPANWNAYGRSAGPIRNKQMAEYCDAVILLPGGRGTASMRKEAIEHDKPILYERTIFDPKI